MINRITLLGNVGKDPEVKQITGDRTVAKFSFATSKTWRDKAGEKVTQTAWHNIVVWGPLAGVVEKYVTKGQTLYLEGEISYRDYEDKDGNKKYFTEIVCNVMQMIGSKSEAKAEVKESDPAELGEEFSDDNFVPPPTNDDIPF